MSKALTVMAHDILVYSYQHWVLLKELLLLAANLLRLLVCNFSLLGLPSFHVYNHIPVTIAKNISEILNCPIAWTYFLKEYQRTPNRFQRFEIFRKIHRINNCCVKPCFMCKELWTIFTYLIFPNTDTQFYIGLQFPLFCHIMFSNTHCSFLKIS